jgi:hypothetical protein
MKSGNLNFLELSGPHQACNGTEKKIYTVIEIDERYPLGATIYFLL